MDTLRRYALPCCILTYMTGIFVLHLCGLFPRPGVYDLSQLIGSSQVILEGKVLDSPIIRWNQTRFLMEGRASPLQAFAGKTLVTLAYPDSQLAPGDRILARGWLSRPRAPFDTYWSSKRVFSMLKVWSPAGLSVLDPSPAWRLDRLAWTFHKRYRLFWESRLPYDECALLLGITVGARGILPQAIKDACIRAGVYHIVVVSGQNMSLIVGLGVSLLLALAVPRRHALWICVIPIVFYTAAVGSDPPVVRAAATALVGLIAAALERDIPRYYPLSLAAGWILIQEPEALLGASFQLSFGATLSILVILPMWDELKKGRSRWKRWFKEAAVLGLAVHIGIWPMLVYYFHRVSFAGLIANWTVFPLSGALMILGLFIGTWGVVAPASVPALLVGLVHGSVQMTLGLIERMAAWRWAVRPVAPLPGWVVWLYYGSLFGILLLIRRRKIHGPHKKSRPRL